MKTWHDLTEKEILSELKTSKERGLSADEARIRLEHYGANELEARKKESLTKRFLMRVQILLMTVRAPQWRCFNF